MNANDSAAALSLEERRQIAVLDRTLRAVAAVDGELAIMLPERSVRRVVQRLDEATDENLLEQEAQEQRRLWQDAGLFYKFSGRYYDAIALFSRLYERICDQQQRTPTWLPKGTPLVWISECHKALGHVLLGARYLLLTAVSDAVRDKGRIYPDGGVYFRAKWQHGWTDEELDNFYLQCSAAYQPNDMFCGFPEHILSKVRTPFVMPYAAQSELNIYELNKVYAAKLLSTVTDRSGSVPGKDLEKLAGYLLSCVPGFEVRSDVHGDGAQYDGLIRNMGPKYDFRSDLGFYVLVECKDWQTPVGVAELGHFINKLVLQDCRGGILFSSRGITGEGKVRDAELQLLKAHYRAGKVIIVLSATDFRDAAAGFNLVSMLRQKYEEVRFELRNTANL